MLRRRVVALGLGLPVLLAAAVACGDDDGGSQPSTVASSAAGGGADPAAIQRGQELSRTKGCSACHGANGEGGLGPAWVGALGSTVTLTDGTQVVVDEAYLTRSIEDPEAQIVSGFSVAMPPQELTPAEVTDLVAYITSLTPSG